jgi:membrane protein YqaA with SNARE-associated domain
MHMDMHAVAGAAILTMLLVGGGLIGWGLGILYKEKKSKQIKKQKRSNKIWN